MTKTAISIYRGLKEKFNPEIHVGFYITTDTNELLIGDTSLGKTIVSGEVPSDLPYYLKLNLNSGDSIYVKIPEASESTPGFISMDQFAHLQELIEDNYSYGIEFDENAIDPKVNRIGNMSLYKDLPIQKQMKGCIVQYNSIQYYLDPNDWRFIEGTNHDFTGGTLRYTRTQTAEDSPWIHANFTFECDQFNTLRFEQSYIKIKTDVEFIAYIKSINVIAHTAQLVVKGNVFPIAEETPGSVVKTNVNYTLGSCRNGYDGTVRIHIPRFYIKHSIRNHKSRIMISLTPLAGWEESPEMFVDAYNATILRTVPQEMGYLSTLEAGTAVSVDNAKDYCRGGLNDATKDSSYVPELKRGFSDLNLPATNMTRQQCRDAAAKSGSRLLSYKESAHLYWLYVIEQANFNTAISSDDVEAVEIGENDYSAEPTHFIKLIDVEYPDEASAGYDTSVVSATPCGYLDRLGNMSGYGTMNEDDDNSITYIKWRGFEMCNQPLIVDGCVVTYAEDDKDASIYIAKELYDNTDEISNKVKYTASDASGVVTSFHYGESEVLNIPLSVGGLPGQSKCMHVIVPSAGGTYQIIVNVNRRIGDQAYRALDAASANTFFKTVITQ